jgi:hypothetical protein
MNLTQNETTAIDQFIDQKTFNPALIDETEVFNEKINQYPPALWKLENPTS